MRMVRRRMPAIRDRHLTRHPQMKNEEAGALQGDDDPFAASPNVADPGPEQPTLPRTLPFAAQRMWAGPHRADAPADERSAQLADDRFHLGQFRHGLRNSPRSK